MTNVSSCIIKTSNIKQTRYQVGFSEDITICCTKSASKRPQFCFKVMRTFLKEFVEQSNYETKVLAVLVVDAKYYSKKTCRITSKYLKNLNVMQYYEIRLKTIIDYNLNQLNNNF